MTLVRAGLLAQLVLTGLAVLAAAVVVPRLRARFAGAAVVGLGMAGAATGAAVSVSARASVRYIS